MSIITDALRKAENERELKSKKVVEADVPIAAILRTEEQIFPSHRLAETNFSQRAKTKSKKPVSGIKQFFIHHNLTWKHPAFIAVSVILFACLLMMALIPKKTVLIVQANKDENIQKQVTKAISSTMQSSPLALPYVLSGISRVGSSEYAIINGMIVQVGDSIDGAYIEEIFEREVTLNTRSGEIKLNLKS